MERFDLIQVEGEITACLRPSLFQVRLPNGHLLLAHLDGDMAQKFSGIASEGLMGKRVLLQLRAFDLSSGRVLGVRES